MIGSFLIAAIIFCVTCIWCFVITLAGVKGVSILPWFIGGSILSLLIVSTHWMGWTW